MGRVKTLTDHLIAAVTANPEDLAARSALADHLTEEGVVGDDWVGRLTNMTHNYQDESYHGSPDWVCRHCQSGEWKERRDGRTVCPKAVEAVLRELRDWLDAEYYEWKRIRDTENRRRELVRRWGEF